MSGEARKRSVPNSPTSERAVLGTLRFAQPTELQNLRHACYGLPRQTLNLGQ